MRVSLLLIFALAALVAAAESKKCKGECVSAGSCEGTETKDKCQDSQVCCVAENNVDVKRGCSPTSMCDDVNGECRKKKCLAGEKRYKNKKTKIYCEGKKKCVCCARSCENNGACNLNGGYCQPIDLPCDGTLMTEKAYCKSNKNMKKKAQCGCCIPTDHVDEDPHWGYEGATGPAFWPTLFPEFCSGSSQSPIDLNDDHDTLETSTDDWVLDRYDIIPDEMIIKNNGHTAQIEWTETNINEVPNVSGGNLGDIYAFAQFHFHWGMKKNRGSEHTINGELFPAELHLVHFNTKYGTIGDAVQKKDGLAVLGVMLEIAKEDNENLTPIINGLSTIVDADSEKTLATSFPLSDLLPADTSSFYRYSGSLTTPTCNEVVTWTVFEDPITISEAQIEKFRELLDEEGHHIEDNFRPVQPLNGRLLEKIQLV